MSEEINNYPISELKEIYDNCPQESAEFEGKTILVLGGSGFIGKSINSYLLYLNKNLFSKPCKIISVDNYVGRSKPIEFQDENIKYIEHDLVLPIEDKLPQGDLNFIINASGNASPSSYAVHSLETIDVSVNAVRNLLRLATLKNAKILNFSSSEVLGTPEDKDVPTNEEYIPRVHTMNPRACYDVGKMMIETLSWIYKEKSKTQVKVVRLFNCIGRMRQDDFRVLPNFLSACYKNEKIKVFAPGDQTRTFSYYTDVIAGCIKVLVKGESLLYHIGNPYNEISIKDFALLVQDITGKKDLVQIVETPITYIHEPKRRCPSIEKASKELGYNPKIDVKEMVQRVHKWAVVNYKY